MNKLRALIVLCLCVTAPVAYAYVSSGTNYRIEFDSINFGGGQSSSGNYSQESTFGEVGTGDLSGTNYNSNSGYQQNFSSASDSATTTDQCNNDGLCAGSETAANCPNDCREPPSQNPPISGCLDSRALNYNPLAKVSDGSCQYLYPGVSDFLAVGILSARSAELTWNNPSNTQGFEFGEVRIVRSLTMPRGPFDGTLVYAGTGENVTDRDLSLNTRYYYGAYVRNSITGQYSAAAIASVFLSEAVNACPPNCPPEDLFENFPLSPTPLGEFPFVFDFIQQSEITKFNGGTVSIDGSQPFTISADYVLFPEVLKTIGVTIFDVKGDKTYSFVLRVDGQKQTYAATIIPFLRAGEYPIVIHLFDYQDQRLRKISGTLVIHSGYSAGTIMRSFGRITGLLFMLAGLLSGAAYALATAAQVRSLFDLYLLVLRFSGAVLGFFGLKKRHEPWGTVYDAATKRPLDPAYVTALRWGEEYRSAITDIDGRYGFFLPPGIYTLSANKTHYKFPSLLVAGKARDEMYDNLYFGGDIVVNEAEVLIRNIPLDPVGFDWNEFAKDKIGFIKFHSRRELLRARIFNSIYYLGFATACLTLMFSPALFNVSMVLLYCTLTGLTVYWRGRHKVVAIRDSVTGNPIPFAIVRFFIPGVDQEVKSVVTDELGRFYQILRPGEYYLTVEERQKDGTYKKIFTSAPMNLVTGVVQTDVEFTAV